MPELPTDEVIKLKKERDSRLVEIEAFLKKYDKSEQPTSMEKPKKVIPDEEIPKVEEPKVEIPKVEVHTPVKKRRRLPIGTILFYGTLITILLVVYLNRSNSGNSQQQPRNMFGYSIYSVLTDSMQSTLPQGSLVLSKYTDPTQIQIGDDITYLREDLTTITHRVIEIHENYDESGTRAFKTQGTENTKPDADLVHAQNVQGVAVFHIPIVGSILTYIQNNAILVATIGAILIALFYILRYFNRNRKR